MINCKQTHAVCLTVIVPSALHFFGGTLQFPGDKRGRKSDESVFTLCAICQEEAQWVDLRNRRAS